MSWFRRNAPTARYACFKCGDTAEARRCVFQARSFKEADLLEICNRCFWEAIVDRPLTWRDEYAGAPPPRRQA